MREALGRLGDFAACALRLGPGLAARWAIFWRETKNVRVRCGIARHRPERVYSLPTVYGRLHFRDNFGDITNLPGLFHREVYRVRALEDAGVILDVGANIGLAAAWFAFHNPGRTIHCFEPVPESARLIPLNCPQARVHRVAVGARAGRVRLRVDPHGVMASRIPCRWETREVEFEVVPLDGFASAVGIGQVALIKIDAEGMEDEILDGARETLRRTRQIVLETHGPTLHDRVLQRLEAAGFAIAEDRFDGRTGLVLGRRSGREP